MKTVSTVAAALTVIAIAALALNPAGAQGKKVPSIEDIMNKAHDEENGLIEKIGKGVDDGKWADAQKQTKEFVPLAEALGKNKPPKGSQDSWAKLTKDYLTDVKALDAAVGKQDKDTATATLKKMHKACAACHKEHKS